MYIGCKNGINRSIEIVPVPVDRKIKIFFSTTGSRSSYMYSGSLDLTCSQQQRKACSIGLLLIGPTLYFNATLQSGHDGC